MDKTHGITSSVYMSPGKKIVIVGVSASGKSTFARALADKLKIPITHIDAFMWRPGWNYAGDEETVSKLKELSTANEWIIEGYIKKDARTILFERADTIIYLDYAPVVASWRYIKRWWKHRKSARPELTGSPEKFSFKFLKLVWRKGETWSLRPFLEEPANRNKLVILTSPKRASDFLKSL